MILLLEKIVTGVRGSIMGDRYVKSDGNIKILFFDANNFYGWAMGESLPYVEIETWHGQLDH